MRWAALLWLAVWFPAYWHVWGLANFLNICDIAVLLTCIGLWRGNALLLSSQALGSLAGNAPWCLDAGWRVVFGEHFAGGTEYMWDDRFPLPVRLLSLFHVFWPMLMIWSVRRVGYDRRALPLQTAITAAALVASRFTDPGLNINFAFRDPFGRTWGPAPLHLGMILLALFVLFWLAHLILVTMLPSYSRGSTGSLSSASTPKTHS